MLSSTFFGAAASLAPASALAQTTASPAPPQGVASPAATAPKRPAPTAGRVAKTARKPPAKADQRAPATTVSALTVYPPKPEYGAAVGDIKPELQLSPADIQSYGVSTVIDLLNEIAPQTRSDHGRAANTATSPVILINGRRISSINEVQNIPTEAILRVDILPEEVSLKYGYTADQRVVNIVLKPYFRAITGEAVGGTTTEGGDETSREEVDQFRVDGDTRLNLDLKYQYAAGLTDAQRGLAEPDTGPPYALAGNVVAPGGGQIDPALSALVGRPVTVAGVPAGLTPGAWPTLADFVPTANLANVTDTAADHSLAPATQTLSANAVMARPIFWGINATFNATLTGSSSLALQGLPGVPLMVPANNPFSPFGLPVIVDRYVAGEDPLRQTIDGWTGHLGMTLNRDVARWRLSLTTAYNHGYTLTETGAGLDAAALQAELNARSPVLDPFGALPRSLLSLEQTRAVATTDGGNIQALANGPLFKLPAGDVYVSAKLGDVEAAGSASSQMLNAVFQAQTLVRNDAQGQLNIDFPIASRRHHVLPPLGDLSVFVYSAIDEYSDFGPLPTLGFGVNWTPIPGYNVIVSEIHDHQAPTIQQLDGPVVATPGVRLFDYATGQTVSITQLTGGNPDLKADDRNVLKVGLTFKPLATHDLTFTANYIGWRIANSIQTFPAATAAIEAAFADRFIRDADGELVEENDTTLNFAGWDKQELRWGVNFSMPVGKQPPPPVYSRRAYQRRRAAPPGGGPGGFGGQGPGSLDTGASDEAGAGGGTGGQGGGQSGAAPALLPETQGGEGGRFRDGIGGGRGGRGGFSGGQTPGGRFQIALYHTVYFMDQFQVTPAGPLLNMLDGAPAGPTGGQYRHEIEGQLGYTDNGYGARLSADWRSATAVYGGGEASTGVLEFSDVATVNFRLWDDFTPQTALVNRYPILRGVRVTFNVTNLFNQSVNVRDTVGATPFIYEAAVLDPTGRVISINLRKVFY